MNRYSYLNLTCLALSLFFILGTFWIWRGTSVTSRQGDLEGVVLVSRENIIKQEDQKIIGSEDHSEIEKDKEGDDLSIFQSSSLNIVEEKKEEEVKPILENAINLDVPFTSQAPEKNWDQPWQDACEEAAVLMLDAYYKDYGLSPLFAKDEILKIVEWEEEQGWGMSIPAEKVKKTLEHFSTSAPQHIEIIENPTVKQIKEFIKKGNPVLVLADGKVLPNPHFQNGGPVYHALIIRGFTEDSFITNDPGTQFGENFLYKYDDLMNAIHDWNGGNVKDGRKVIIVINQ